MNQQYPNPKLTNWLACRSKRTFWNQLLTIILISFFSVHLVQADNGESSNAPIDYNNEQFYANILQSGDFQLIDFSQMDLVTVENAVAAMEAQGIFEEISFYQEAKNIELFFSGLDASQYHLINAQQVIAAGQGEQLNQGQIQANINEVSDLSKLSSTEFSKYFTDIYEVRSIDVSSCNLCTLKEGVLRNEGSSANSLNLQKFSSLTKTGALNADKIDIFTATFILTPIGEINFDLGDYLPTHINLDYVDKYTLINIPAGLALKSPIQGGKSFVDYHLISEGTATINFGHLDLILPSETGTTIDGVKILSHNQVITFVDDAAKINPAENYLFMDGTRIIASGDGYGISFLENNPYIPLSSKKYDHKNIRDGNRIMISPSSSMDYDGKSKVTLTAGQTPQLLLEGTVRIINGDEFITARNSRHFLSERGGFVAGEFPYGQYIKPEDQKFNLVDMKISFACETENSITVENNNLKIGGGKTVYYSVKYNEEGQLKIDEHLGERAKASVVRPEIVILSPKTFSGACGGDGSKFACTGMTENDGWESLKEIILANKNPDQMIIFYDFDKKFTGKKEVIGTEANDLLKDILSAREQVQGRPLTVTFYGHSSWNPETKTYGFETGSKGGVDVAASELQSLDFIGCAAAETVAGGDPETNKIKTGITTEQVLTLAAFESYKNQNPAATLSTPEGQSQFVNALNSAQIKLPAKNCQNTAKFITQSLNKDIWYGKKGLGGFQRWNVHCNS